MINPYDGVYLGNYGAGFSRGMDIRTHIATQLLAGLLSCSEDCVVNDVPDLTIYEKRAECAIRHADALIRRLNAGG